MAVAVSTKMKASTCIYITTHTGSVSLAVCLQGITSADVAWLEGAGAPHSSGSSPSCRHKKYPVRLKLIHVDASCLAFSCSC